MSGKDMNDKEWVTYMMLHYIKNNENKNDILKDLNITESYFYKRNRELGIKRNSINKRIIEKSFKFNIISGKFMKGKIELK